MAYTEYRVTIIIILMYLSCQRFLFNVIIIIIMIEWEVALFRNNRDGSIIFCKLGIFVSFFKFLVS